MVKLYCGDYNVASLYLGREFPNELLDCIDQHSVTRTGKQFCQYVEEYFSRMRGTRLFIFSNNDHLLNTLRLMVKEGRLGPEEVYTSFFTEDFNLNDGDEAPVHPCINSDGCMSNWPKGFFDTWDICLEKLLS